MHIHRPTQSVMSAPRVQWRQTPPTTYLKIRELSLNGRAQTYTRTGGCGEGSQRGSEARNSRKTVFITQVGKMATTRKGGVTAHKRAVQSHVNNEAKDDNTNATKRWKSGEVAVYGVWSVLRM